MLRQYDEAMKQFCSRKMPNGAVVPVVGPVPPLRAFASMRELLKDDPRVVKDPRFIPQPYISFDRLNPVLAQNRYQRADIRKASYSPDGNMTTVANRPIPWDIPYVVEIWAEKEDDGAYLLEAFLRKWRRPMAYIDVYHGEPFGLYKIGIPAPIVADNSVKEAEDTDREIRYTLTMTVEGFLSFPAVNVPTVRDFVLIEETTNRPKAAPQTIDQSIIPFEIIGEETT